jgi:hypothetical protein
LTKRIKGPVDAVITSPPYHSAVDYYRRHTLETYWLGLTRTFSERLKLRPKYIGRCMVPKTHDFVKNGKLTSPIVRKWENKLRAKSPGRGDAFRHYVVTMQKALSEVALLLRPGSPAVFVVGKSKWGDEQIPTDLLFSEMARDWFEVTEHFYYPLKNRYMSYARRNGADINEEHVLVLVRK